MINLNATACANRAVGDQCPDRARHFTIVVGEGHQKECAFDGWTQQ